MKQEINQSVEILRESFLKPEELFLVKYLEKFDRGIEKKWRAKNLAIFAKA